jgi:hypothetical protein
MSARTRIEIRMKPIEGAGLGCRPDSDLDDPKAAANIDGRKHARLTC